jgi:hypothetical protein
MANTMKGKTILWGVPSDLKTIGAAAVTAAAVVKSASLAKGGKTTTITDEEDDVITRVDSAFENKFDFEVVCVATTALPAKGAKLTATGTVHGVVLTTGQLIVDDAKLNATNGSETTATITATHYPEMPADG